VLGWMGGLVELFKRTAQLLLHEIVVGRHVDLLLLLLSCLHLLVSSDIPVLIWISLFRGATTPGLVDKDIDGSTTRLTVCLCGIATHKGP
jgi:hypothetical protein